MKCGSAQNETSIIVYKHTLFFLQAPCPVLQLCSFYIPVHPVSLSPTPTLLMLPPSRFPARAHHGILDSLLHLPNQLMCPQPLLRHHLPLLRLRQLLSGLAELGCLIAHFGEEGDFLLLL